MVMENEIATRLENAWNLAAGASTWADGCHISRQGSGWLVSYHGRLETVPARDYQSLLDVCQHITEILSYRLGRC